MTGSELIDDLQARGLVAQMSGDGELIEHLRQPRTLYCGFDPTAESLHIGSLVPLLALRRFQLAGHRPLALVGGATGMIGDPSFKAQERKLNTPDVVGEWAGKLRDQIGRFLDFDAGPAAAVAVNNLEWTQGVGILDFLRDVGKHFSVNAMIHKESVKQRLEREGEGISFTEFSYALLQAYDFAELNRRFDCTVQLGGSDQWGNITGGIDLVRRLNRQQAYGLTLPLVTKADGSKFGKTEAGNVWLDPAKTSPYTFYQFWLNTADADVYRFLHYFTFIPVADIAEVERADAERSGRPEAQGLLADAVTRLVHGESGLTAARRITEALFTGGADQLGLEDFEQLKLDGLPCTPIRPEALDDVPLTTVLSDAGMAKAAREVKDALGRQAVVINGEPVSMDDNMSAPALFDPARARFGRFFLVRLGKKKYHLFECPQ